MAVEKVLEMITKWGVNASPFNVASKVVKLNWKGVTYWKDVAKRVSDAKELLKSIDGLEKGARALKQAADELRNAEVAMPHYPLQSSEKAGSAMVSSAEMESVERYRKLAGMIVSDCFDTRLALTDAINGWDNVLSTAKQLNDFTRQSAWDAINQLDMKFSNSGGSFRAFLVQARDTAARTEDLARMKMFHAASILGGNVPDWYVPPTPAE